MAKRARELAVKERRERKRAKKADAAAARTAPPPETEPERIGEPPESGADS
jgi:hypothetical protein